MTRAMTELADLHTGSVDKIADTLRTNGLLPLTTTIQPVPAEALNAITPGQVETFAHIRPDKPHIDNRAGILANLSGLFTFDPPSLDFSAGSEKFLLLHFSGFSAGQSGHVHVRLKINPPTSASVQITATNNPLTMSLTNAATAGKPVTVTVRFREASGSAGVFIRPSSNNDSFNWFSAVAATVST